MFQRFNEGMYSDHLGRGVNEQQATDKCVRHITYILATNDKYLQDLGLPLPKNVCPDWTTTL